MKLDICLKAFHSQMRYSTIISSLLLMILSIYLHMFHNITVLYIPLSILIVITVIINILFHDRKNKITLQQVESLLKLDNGKISVERLSSVTNTKIDDAEKYLNHLVATNILDTEIDETSLVYKKK